MCVLTCVYVPDCPRTRDRAAILLLGVLIGRGTVNQLNINPVFVLKFSKSSGSKCTDADIATPEPPGAAQGTGTPCRCAEEAATR